MSEIFFTSDSHFGHAFIANLRGFSINGMADSDSHDAMLIEKWNSRVSKRDTVYHLGDLSMNAHKGISAIAKCNGKKFLIPGNHDRCHPMNDGWYNQQRNYAQVFDGISMLMSHRIAGRRVMLSHMPYLVDHHPASRFMEWRARDEGLYLLHGHTHSPWKWGGERQIHVGVDAWGFYPVHRDEIDALIRDSLENLNES